MAGFRNLGARDNFRLPMSITSKVTRFMLCACVCVRKML